MLDIYVVSDSTGETAYQYANSIIIQFPDLEFRDFRYSNVKSTEQVDELFNSIERQSIIIMTMVLEDIREYLLDQAEENQVKVIDMLGGPLSMIEEITGKKALRLPGLMRGLDSDYFDKMESIEFAIKYDDGKDERGLLKADIVLVGVSRTSKTPLSMLLANKNYKVANLPLVPEIDLPDSLFQVDKNKIVGLIIDPDNLNSIREDRIKALGLSEASDYAKKDRIRDELVYARKVFDRIGCEVIDVTGSTIEETATKVISIIDKKQSK